MKDKGLFGPFENPDDINKYWYQFEEEELKKHIKQTKKNYEDPNNSKEDREIYKQDLKELNKQLKDLRSYIDDYTRCIERYKFDKKALQQLEDDWQEYNISLYTDWSRIQSMMLDSGRTKGKRLKVIRAEAKAEKIKREEIEKRVRDLLSK